MTIFKLFSSICYTCILMFVGMLLYPGDCLSDYKKKDINQTVLSPVPDGIRMMVPQNLGNQDLARIGAVDVTALPFKADPSGKTDSTQSIQAAINFARDHQMVCFFPAGNYLISDTLDCIQNNYIRTTNKRVGGRFFPCVLMGSRADSSRRPKIILKKNADGFSSPKIPKYVLHFWARHIENQMRPKPNSSMNQMFIGIDIEIRPGNAGAVAIRHRAAQGSGIQDCNIDVRYGLTGIEGGIGSGGSMANITIQGGKTGLDLRQTQPVPTLVGITLINQEKTAILYSGRQSLSAVGVNIHTSGRGPVIRGLDAGSPPATGQISLIDSQIIFKNPGDTAISSEKSLYLNNVYIKNAQKAVYISDGTSVAAQRNGWIRIIEFAKGVRPKKWKGYQYTAPTYINGSLISDIYLNSKLDQTPPSDLQSRHLWPDKFPSFESSEAVNVKSPPYHAKGDSFGDDTDAIQRALSEHSLVFLPKGYYRVSRPLKLNPNNQIVGIARHLSTIMIRPSTDGFMDKDKPTPIIQTPNQKKTSVVMAFLCLYAPNSSPGAYPMLWQSGNAVLRDVNFNDQPIKGFSKSERLKYKKRRLVVVSGYGGGRWYNFFKEGRSGQSDDYRHLLIDNTQGPLAIYQCNVEHATSKANMEIRNAGNVSIFGLKSEGNQPVLKIKNSNDIHLFGYGGNAAAFPGQSLFEIENCQRFLFANMVDSPRLPFKRSSSRQGIDPNVWQMIQEISPQGEAVSTNPLERPVLYKRNPGQPLQETNIPAGLYR